MILHPSVIALLSGAGLISLMLLHASFHGIRIMTKWDLSSGSDLQLSLEKKTYLISTVVSYAFGFQIASLFLFIYTTDSLSSLLVGAMCAAGALNANVFGYPVFLLKLLNFILAGLWLVLNHADNRAVDYPLIRKKYILLLVLTPLVLVETYVQFRYFLSLEADVITSCCGSLFSSAESATAPDIFHLPAEFSGCIFFALNVMVLLLGWDLIRKGKGAYLFAGSNLFLFIVSAFSLLHFISSYIYEMPAHHCPFCILRKEYAYVGYLFYFSSLTGCVAGSGTGVLEPFRKVGSLAQIIPDIQRRLAVTAVACCLLFLLTSAYYVIFSSFRFS